MGFVGILLVLGAVLGGYLMEGGEVGVLIQPAELVIIMGAALGSVLISTPLKVIIEILQSLTKVLTGAAVSKTQYFELLSVKDAHSRRTCRHENGSEPWACCDCDCTKKLEERLATQGNSFLKELRQTNH